MVRRKSKFLRIGSLILVAVILGGAGSYFSWYHFGYGKVPKFAVRAEVEQRVDTSSLSPVISSFHSSGCGSFAKFYKISYKTIENNLYLVIKCNADMLFGSSVNFSKMGDNLVQVNISVGYVNCIFKSAVFIYIPDVGVMDAIDIHYICPIPDLD